MQACPFQHFSEKGGGQGCTYWDMCAQSEEYSTGDNLAKFEYSYNKLKVSS